MFRVHDLRVEVTVHKHAAIPIEPFGFGLGAPPLAFWVILAMDVDIEIVSFEILPCPSRLANAGL